MRLSGLSKWQWTTVGVLTIGYMGYYFCRSNLSVAAPLLIEEFGDQGFDKAAIGRIAFWGTLFYAFGKLFNGVLSDFVGGRRIFLFGMIASVAATLVFGFGVGTGVFLVAWCANRLVQSMGWGALVKTASHWFPVELMGTILGILCLSYLFGDVVAKLVLGQVIAAGLGWKGVFFFSAAVLGTIFLIASVLLKSSPAAVGEEESPAHPDNVYADDGNAHRPSDILDLMLPLVTSFSFWLVCIMNAGLTMIREVFNFWTPTYLVEAVGMDPGNAAKASALFPLLGGLSVLFAGVLSDRVTKGGRGGIMFVFLLLGTGALFLLSQQTAPTSPVIPLILIASVGFLILAPYAFLTGVVCVDLGGKRGSSTAAGIADTVGYLAGAASIASVASLAENRGWSSAFFMLSIVLAITAAAALLYWYVHEVRGKKTSGAMSHE